MDLYHTLKLQGEDGILTVTLNRPQTLNSLTPEMMDELGALCDWLAENNEARVVLFTGAGKGFCAGLDLEVLTQAAAAMSEDELRVTIRRWQGVLTKLENVPQITIAAINGPCLGAGVELIAACDFRISSSRALFGLPEVKYGLIPDLGGITRLTRMVGPAWAKEIILRGRNISAMEALRIGLLNRVADPGDMFGIARNWAQQLAKMPPQALAHAKRLINATFDHPLATALHEAECAQLSLLASDEFRAALAAMRDEHMAEVTG